MLKTYLYDAEGRDREITLKDDAVRTLADHHILWVDVTGAEEADIVRLRTVFGLGAGCAALLTRRQATFSLNNYGDYFHCDVPAVVRNAGGRGLPRSARRVRLDFVVAPQWLITVHAEDLDFLVGFREQDKGETMIGALTGPQVAASLLDWHLEAYLDALEDVEIFVEGLETRILARRRVRDALLGDIMLGRRYVSSLRRLLGPQRAVFYGVSRPDFTQVAATEAAVHYDALERRFERTLDALDHGRELVQSAFDLFTTRTAETTNILIRRLTFLSVLLGATAAVASLLGMNFPPPFTHIAGAFWVIMAVVAVSTATAVAVARWRKWI